ncbi:MAG: zinc ribbon domain-containing protein, partial [Anaerolineales bacterium]
MTEQRCPKCNEPYPAGAASCPSCGAPLVRICPTCGARRAWNVAVCPRCSARAEDQRTFTALFDEVPRERIQGRYAVQDVLAQGRVGRVLRAVDRHEANRPVALKELPLVRLFRPDERREALAALFHQVERWRNVGHPALPRIDDAFTLGERVYIVMELVPGWDGARLIDERSVGVTPELARNWGAQLCDLLAALHASEPPLDVAFLAPEHVLITPQGQVKLVGLGLGRLVAPTTYGPYGSTSGYAAPELATSFPSPRSDIYAVGRLLYALLARVDLARGQTQAPPLQRAMPGISSQLVKAIARAAHRDSNLRFASARQFGRALWDPTYGPLVPIDNWYATARRTPEEQVAAPTTPRQAPATPSAPAETMESLGFAADARFGRRPQSAPAQAAAASPVARGALSVQPRQFVVSDLKPAEKRRLVLSLRNVGSVEVTGRVISHVSWLSAPAKAFTLPVGKQAKVLLTLDANALPAGKTIEPQALSLESNASPVWVGVTVDIASGPQLVVEPERFDLGALQTDTPQPLTLTIRNAGRQTMAGTVASRVPWLRVDRPDFRCLPGRAVDVTVILLPERLGKGPVAVADALVIASDGGQAQIEVRAWRPRPALELGATHMDLGTCRQGEVAERYLIVSNPGDGVLEGAVRSLVPWLQAHPREFTVAPGEMTQLTVSADLAGLPDGRLDIAQALRVQSNAGTQSMSLRVVVSAPRLVLSRETLDWGAVPYGERAELPLVISNGGTAPLELGLSTLVPCLSLDQTALTLAPGESRTVRLTADTQRFGQGQAIEAEPALRLTQASAILDLPASITVVKPALRVEPEVIDWGYIDPAVAERREVTLINDGNGRLAWAATTAAPWVELAPTQGVCAPGEQQTIALTAYGLMLPLEAEGDESSLVINSDGGRAKVTLRIAKAHPLIAADTALLILGPSINLAPVSGSLRVFNHGLGLLRGSVSASEPWLAVDRVSFECPTGRSTEINVHVDPAELPSEEGDLMATLDLTSNGGDLSIDVSLRVE